MAARRKDREQGIYRRVSVRMWGDAKVRALTPPPPGGLALWFHLLTGEQTGIIPGLHKIGEAAFAEQLGWPLEGFREAFREVEAQGMARADWAARVVWVPKAIEHNIPASPNAVRAWADAWDLMPECSLKAEAWRAFRAFLEAFSEAFVEAFDEACPEPSVKASGNQEQEQEQEKSSPPRASAFARDEGHDLDPEAEQHPSAARPETASGATPHRVETAETPRGPAGAPPATPGPLDASAPATGSATAAPRLPHGLAAACAIEYPHTARLLAALEALGTPGAWAAKSETRRAVEDAIGEQLMEALAPRVAEVIRETGLPWLGHHVAVIRRRAPRRTHGDLGVELRPWPEKLTAEERAAARAELAAIHPDLADAPLVVKGVPGIHPVEAIAEFHEKWRAHVEGRP